MPEVGAALSPFGAISPQMGKPLSMYSRKDSNPTSHQRQRGQAVAICARRDQVYAEARERHPHRWSRGTRCWRQPEDVWINPPQLECNAPKSANLKRSACPAKKASSFLAATAVGHNTNPIQKSLYLCWYQRLYSTVQQCEAALEKVTWPGEVPYHHWNGHGTDLVYSWRLKQQH
jgi:hypothetical protein